MVYKWYNKRKLKEKIITMASYKNRKEKMIRLFVAAIVVCAAAACGFVFTGQDSDSISHDGTEYVPLHFSEDIFYYDLNIGIDYEEGVKYSFEGRCGSMLYYDGDIYCEKGRQEETVAYYADDGNYEWQITVETEDSEQTYRLELTDEELIYLYGMEDMKKEFALYFEDIEKFGTLAKISKDGLIEGVTELGYYNGSWYWRSEIIDENREKDGTWPEYMQKLPATMIEKIEQQ